MLTLHQVHTNIVIFNLRNACPLSAKDFIPLLQQHGVLIIPFRCTTCIFLQSTSLIHIMAPFSAFCGRTRMAAGFLNCMSIVRSCVCAYVVCL